MYKIIFYKDKNGKSDFSDYLDELYLKTDKDSHINLEKITSYLNMLIQYGTRIGFPVTRYLDGEIWELRPLKNRILYAYMKDDQFLILHHFIKKTQKTPRRELAKAKRNLKDYKRRMNL